MFSSSSSQVSTAANYIEDVFSTYLYTGIGTSQSISNGVDVLGKGGLVWLKLRQTVGYSTTQSSGLFDTARGDAFYLSSDLTNAQLSFPSNGISFTNSGFDLDAASFFGGGGDQPYSYYASWTFRKQAKFFDVVTYTGNGANRTIAHNLGSVPGCIMIKRTDTTGAWAVYHRSLANTQYAVLNTTAAAATGATYWNSTTPTSSVFSLGTATDVNASGGTYVAYLFAHDAGGFGAAGTDNVISCGSFTTNASGIATVTLGYEPQWVLIKRSSSTGAWHMLDTMRGFSNSNDAWLMADSSVAENSTYAIATPTATGFVTDGTSVIDPSSTFIYIAIRRGPMKTPTSGTSVFSAKTYVGTTTSAEVTHDVTFDVEISANRGTLVSKYLFVDSLRGINGVALQSAAANTESSYPSYWSRKSQRTMYAPSAFDDWWAATSTNQNHISYGLVRAPGFFDVVCYTGTGANTTQTHNLGVAPELMIVKSRNNATGWVIYSQTLGANYILTMNSTNAATGPSSLYWNSTNPTSNVFSLGTISAVNGSAYTLVAYLFATCPGVSKVGSYTGTGTTQQINCGFTGGARFVLIKRTDSTGDWYVWDSARGIVAGNDPYLLLNSTAAEVTNTDYIDTYSAGFEISSTAPAAINANGGSYIFLAIA